MLRFMMYCAVGLVAAATVVFLSFVFSALAIGAGNAWVLEGTFSDGWSRAWDRPIITFLWGLLFLSSGSALGISRR